MDPSVWSAVCAFLSLSLCLSSYLPLRGDFDVEYDNDAEALLADLSIDPQDTPAEKAQKLSLVEAYNCRLDERIYRKRTVLWRKWDDLRNVNREVSQKTEKGRETHQPGRINKQSSLKLRGISLYFCLYAIYLSIYPQSVYLSIYLASMCLSCICTHV